MKSLLIYATYSGSTAEVSNYIAEEFKTQNKILTVKEARHAEPAHFIGHDLIILGSPTWGEGEAHELFKRLFDNFGNKTLPNQKFAVFGLGDRSYAKFCTAADYLEQFVSQVKGKLVTQTLRIDNFYFNQQTEIPRIASWAQKIITSTS